MAPPSIKDTILLSASISTGLCAVLQINRLVKEAKQKIQEGVKVDPESTDQKNSD